MNNKRTLVVGASENEERYSNKAVKLLRAYNHDVVALGVKSGRIDSVQIATTIDPSEKFDTVTMYVNPSLQQGYYKQILDLKPNRVIFNPGTENPEFEKLLKDNNIEPIEACTLVMLRTNQF
jgi:predicted CoA-binding protein